MPDWSRVNSYTMSLGNFGENFPNIGKNIQNPKSENIATVPEIFTFTSVVSETQSEKIHSGESLFKTFVFNQCVNGAEIDKCKTFWEGVIKKKLEPIKCSIIEKVKKDEISTEDSNKCKKEIEKAIEQVHLQYKELWSNMLQEVKKRKLDELKLIGNRKCMFCSGFYPPKCHSYKENETEIKDIKELNCQKKSSSVHQLYEKDEKNTTEDVKNTADEKTILTSKYEFVNVIDERKKESYYSRWREQDMKCGCEQENCYCKKQSYISIMKPSVSSEDKISVNILCEEENPVNIPDQLRLSPHQLIDEKIEKGKISSKIYRSDVALQREQETGPSSLPKSKEESNGSSTDGAEQEVVFIEQDEKLYLTPTHTRSTVRQRGVSILKIPVFEVQDTKNMLNDISTKEVKHIGPPIATLIKKDSLEIAREKTRSTLVVSRRDETARHSNASNEKTD